MERGGGAAAATAATAVASAVGDNRKGGLVGSGDNLSCETNRMGLMGGDSTTICRCSCFCGGGCGCSAGRGCGGGSNGCGGGVGGVPIRICGSLVVCRTGIIGGALGGGEDTGGGGGGGGSIFSKVALVRPEIFFHDFFSICCCSR